MYFDRFDIVEAYFCFFTDYHDGQWSDKYKRLSKIYSYFTPRHSLRMETLSENAREIYDNLITKEG